MRDTYVLIIFSLLIVSATYLAKEHIVGAEFTILPIITGFLGLLAKMERPIQPSVPLLQRLGISKPPPTLRQLTPTDPPKDD